MHLKPFDRFVWILFVLTALSASAKPGWADVTLPAVLADHMVVQRGLPVHVWGMASAGEAISVTFRAEAKSTTADVLGRWSVYLAPVEAGGPFSITVKGSNTIVLNDVLVGDVWVASGQSNMELPMTRVNNAESEIAAAQYPKIRIFQIKKKTADYPLTDVDAKTWAACTPETVADSSAVAYFFARNVQQKTGVPIGLIETYWGGTAAEAWTSLHSLAADPALMPVFAARAKAVDDEAEARLWRSKEDRELQQAIAQAKAEGRPVPSRPYHPDFQAWAPGALYNAMVAPLTPFAIRGVIWYQGEANSGADRAYLYARVFQTMIRDWRAAWGEGDFPFLFVQIANWNTSPEGLWPEVRESQRQALALKNTAMAVIIDTSDGTDLHPKNKQDVGLRLALAARATVYGEKIEYSGPMFRQMATEDRALRLWFDHATGGLVAKGDVLKGFEVAGDDGKFVVADAHIDGTSVVVSSSTVPAPVAVRYGWAPNPDCNLYNRDGLPASPFRSAK